jgi:hypothetical protein
MNTERVITLGTDGVFVAPARGATCHLMFDSSVPDGRWLLSYTMDGSEEASLLSIHTDLDDGLERMAEQAGWDLDRFSVTLPEGEVYTRPGKVPSGEILESYGYGLLGTVVAYAMLDPGPDATRASVRAELMLRLMDISVGIDSLEPVGPPDTEWCAGIGIVFDGFIHRSAVGQMAADYLGPSGLEVTGELECDWFGDEEANMANVIAAFPKAA